ncbi:MULTISPECIES: sugar phosphate isomerase/epimerase family protein [Actinomadura]|uniref:Sugar phosphate isomerase/epimerase n=1 Tax=Actinomadura miaoliensis TaxID=430685 RepID=A0ABP7V4Q7_9ACTN
MNKLGVHALVWTGGWDEDEARRAIAETARAGFDLIELSVPVPSSVDTGMTRRLLDEHGLEVACSLGLRFDADISSPDPEVARRGAELLDDALSLARGVGAGYLGGVIYSALGKYPGPATPQGRRNCVDGLARLAEKAAADGITLGLEVVNRYESNILNTAEQALELIDEVGADNVVVHLDTYHMNIEEPDFAAPVETCGARLGYVHIGESHRGYLGTGTVDFPQFFAALARSGYDGVITFESFSSAVVSPALSNDLAVWRNLWQDGADLARHAREFIASGLAAARG